MSSRLSDESASRVGLHAAWGTLLGILLSGPLAVAVVNLTHPQPPWGGAALFARSYHPVQLLPYAGGIVLVAALVLLVSSLHTAAAPEQRVWTTVALVLSATFASFIFFNYVVQTTFIPELAKHYDGINAPIISTLSMVNPRSLAWGIEMWGWGLFGVATWLVAPVFRGSALERATRVAFISNGPVSVAGALATVAWPGWVMTSAGLALFAVWNLLLAAMALLAIFTFRRRLRTAQNLR
jgi:hypothetical protein